ncbi:MAG: hypothetical protein IJN50_04240 [Clostridia bacterium]|nr:hypothetical protein [Clostridiales bacterium]MBQ6992103.1 hypothetical protein [Clostridia bacterium]
MKKEKKYEATIASRDRNTGTVTTISFFARNKKDAKKIANEKCDSMEFLYCPDIFFVSDVHKVK